MKIDKKTAEKIVEVLADEVGFKDHLREPFIDYVLNGGNEFRFQGDLGFGGKFYNASDKWRVGYYQEDHTPERDEAVWRVNHKLQSLYTDQLFHKVKRDCYPETEKYQKKMDMLFEYIPSGTDSLVDWLLEFVETANYGGTLGAVVYDSEALIAKLKSFAYEANAHVGETQWNRRKVGEYIVGQVISCLERNFLPSVFFLKQMVATRDAQES